MKALLLIVIVCAAVASLMLVAGCPRSPAGDELIRLLGGLPPNTIRCKTTPPLPEECKVSCCL